MPDSIVNEREMTELHSACYHGELDWVQNCLNAEFDVHARDRDGYTPLHWAVDMGMVGGEREAIVSALMRAGADVNARDDSGETPLDVAHRVDATYLIPLLTQPP